MHTKYQNCKIGMTKKEILDILGEEFNFYPDKVWSYVLKKSWWGRKRILIIEFDDDDKVISRYIVNRYGKA